MDSDQDQGSINGGSTAKENERIKELLRYDILDTPDEEEFDDITKVAAYLCDVNCAQINFLDHNRQWSKSCYGWDLREIPRDQSICTHTIQQDKYLVVNDVSKDSRFNEYDYVKEKKVQFYAGVVLKSSHGYNIGTLCVFGNKPKELTDEQLESLQTLGRDVEAKLELRLKREQLIEEHKKLKKTAAFLHNSADLMLILDPDTLKIEEVNNEVEELLGYSTSEVLGSKITDYIRKDGFKEELDDWKSNDSRQRFSYESTFKTKENNTLWLRISITKEPDKYFVTGRNITPLKEIEQNLYKQKQFTENIIRHLPGIFFLIDEHGKIQQWNNNLENIDKRDEENVINQSYKEFIAEEDLQTTNQTIQKVLKEGYARAEINYIAPSGQTIPILVSGFRYQEENTNYIIGIGINITEEKKALEKLERKEKKLEEAQRIGKMGSWTWNIPDNDLQWSDEVYEIYGLNKDTFEPSIENYRKLLPESELEKVNNIIERIREGKEWEDAEIKIQKPDGSIVYIHERAEMYFDDEGNPIEVIGTMQDVTDRRNAEEKIKSALKEKDVLLAEIHHRVKNNLAIINSMLQLEIYNSDNKQLANILTQSQMRIKTMALVHEALYSSGDFTNISLQKYLKELIQSVVDSTIEDSEKIDLKIEMEDFGLTINQAIPCGLIVNELVTNALTHAFPDAQTGILRISIKEKQDHVYLTVSDNGIGIDTSIDIQNPDTLGLTLVNTLVDQLQGKFEVDRKNGTKVSITFKKRNTKGSGANTFFQKD